MSCYLRPLEEADITDDYVSWFADDVVTEFLEARALKREDCVWFFEEGLRTQSWFIYAICDPETDRVIGTAKIGPVDRKSMVSDLVVLIGNRDFWGKGLATHAIRQASKIAFEDYGIRKLHGGMYESNIGSIKAYLRGGWVVEAILHGHYVLSGEVMDRVVVSCFNPAFFPELPELPSTQYDAFQTHSQAPRDT